nr:ATP-binding protein [Desulfovibrio oxyclinae]
MPNLTILSTEEVELILAKQESHFIDFKDKRITPGKLTKSLSGFANAAGGELYVGIAEQENSFVWDGFERQEDANQIIQTFDEIFNFPSGYDCKFLQHPENNDLVLHIEVRKNPKVIKASDGNVYLRRSAQSVKLTEERIKELEYSKGISSFEDELVPINTDEISNSLVALEFVLNTVPNVEPDEWLCKQQLIIKEKPTVAGVLLFSDEPQAFLPKQSGIKILQYKSREEKGERDHLAGDPITIEGCLYEIIYEAVNKVKEIVESIRVYRNGNLESIQYPSETLHEILTNAIIHRDYSIQTDIQVRIFDNRIEVESPGTLPGYITVENILAEQYSRNPKIVRLINKFPNPPNKDVGEGLNTAFDAMKNLKLKPPKVEEKETSVLVTIKHEPLESPIEAIIAYVCEHGSITNRIGRELTGISSENTMKNHFYKMRDNGELEQVPDLKGNKAAWRFTEVGIKKYLDK